MDRVTLSVSGVVIIILGLILVLESFLACGIAALAIGLIIWISCITNITK